MSEIKIPKRILSQLLNSLSAGVVPRTGAAYIAIGRNAEIAALHNDLEAIADGGSAMRFVVGKYGSGKSFLIQLMRSGACEHGFVSADADLSPERRLSGSNHSGIATYRELIKNLSVKACPDGGALPSILAKWLGDLRFEAEREETPEDGVDGYVSRRIYDTLRGIEGGIGAFDFAKVIKAYYLSSVNDDEDKKSMCMRWLRGEYMTKTEARMDLGVGSVINDENFYDYLKLWAVFFRRLGYKGFLVFLDECVNLYKIPNRVSRENNYEKILAMFNDTMQGKASGIGIIMAGTPQFLEDTRRGLYSYEALRSRLCPSGYESELMQSGGYNQSIGPILRLRRMSDDEFLALIKRITILFCDYYGEVKITDEEEAEFLRANISRTGAETMVTPREMIRDYMALLSVMKSNPDVTAKEFIEKRFHGASQRAAGAAESENVEF